MMSKTEIHADYDNFVTNCGGSDPDDEWSRDSTSTTWSVNGLTVGSGNYHGLYLDGEVSPGDQVWLVWAVWSDGDSFGHDADARIDFVTVHRDEETARLNAELLRNVNEDDQSYGHKVILILDDGTELPYTVPWLGYFESLSYIGCESFSIGGNKYLPKNKRG